MKYTKLGKTDLNISRICMGCMGFGNAKTGQHSWTVDEETSRGIIKKALELGKPEMWFDECKITDKIEKLQPGILGCNFSFGENGQFYLLSHWNL